MKPTFDRPSMTGRTFGLVLAEIAAVGRGRALLPEQLEMCATCAFRPGTMPNQMPSTLIDALNCISGIEEGDFWCHHGTKEGEPQKVCAGYAAAKLAPYEMTQERLTALCKRIEELSLENGVDAVRADFDAWYEKADPDGKMDAYQLARAYAGRK